MNQPTHQHDIREQLSALIDGELERDSARFLLRRIGHDDALCARWDRWHRYGETMRGAALPLREDFSARIMAVIENESQPVQAEQPSARQPLLRWGGGFAVAASVALAALLLVKPAPNGELLPAGNSEVASGIASGTDVLPDTNDSIVAPSPYREQDLRLPQRISAQTVSALDNSGYGLKFGFDPNVEAYWLRHQQATNGSRIPQSQNWVVPMRAPEPQAATR